MEPQRHQIEGFQGLWCPIPVNTTQKTAPNIGTGSAPDMGPNVRVIWPRGICLEQTPDRGGRPGPTGAFAGEVKAGKKMQPTKTWIGSRAPENEKAQ